MLKVRYFKIQVQNEFSGFLALLHKESKSTNSPIRILASGETELIFTYAFSRPIKVRRILDDGSEKVDALTTVDIYNFRFFSTSHANYLCVIDPPRGGAMLTGLLNLIMGDSLYFVESLDFTPELIRKHAEKFDSARLVSAKVRDFEVYKGAVGRLEITSRDGLSPTIAPFLEDKFYRVDALTYEVSEKFMQGLIYYYRNGTLKVTGPLVELAFPSFERCFD